MERHLEQSLDDGSIGFSTGLNCMPSSFADFDELVSFCRVLKPFGAYYSTHMRDYKFHVVEAVEEAIRLAEEADVAVQLSHVQVVGKKNWRHLDTILELVDGAAKRGIDVGMDAYPYLAGSCSLVQFLPEWCQDGGLPALLECLESTTQRERIARETDDYMSNTWSDIVVCGVKHDAGGHLLGKSIEQIAVDRNTDPPATAMDMLREQEGVLSVISFNSCEDNLRRVLSHPLTSVCSDSLVTKGLNHPRTFGTYPEFLGKYVRERGWMSLEEGIAKTSALPARRFRLQRRGTICAGNWADLVVFDAATIGTKSNYTSPSTPPEGIRLVIINGEIVCEQGKLTGNRPGAALRFQKQ
jgi:N-acyl-D-aspartate/D-glutamate deacylase